MEAHGGAQFKALAHALFFVRADAVAPAGGDVLQTEQCKQGFAERRMTALAQIQPVAGCDRVEVAADRALLGALGSRAVCVGILALGHRQVDLVDDVARAFVVDDGARAELGDGQEARPGQEFVGVALDAPAGDIGRERQAREAVAGQEAFAGEVAVGVEVGLDDVLGFGQQLDLALGLLAQALGLVVVVFGARVIVDDLLLRLLLALGGAVQAAPALAGLLELDRDLLEHRFQPGLVVPIGVGQFIGNRVQDRLGALLRLLGVGLGVQGGLDRFEQFQRWVVAGEIQQFFERKTQIQPALGQPDGMHVRAHQVFVGQVEARRGDRAGHHQVGALEVILVVRAADGGSR